MCEHTLVAAWCARPRCGTSRHCFVLFFPEKTAVLSSWTIVSYFKTANIQIINIVYFFKIAITIFQLLFFNCCNYLLPLAISNCNRQLTLVKLFVFCLCTCWRSALLWVVGNQCRYVRITRRTGTATNDVQRRLVHVGENSLSLSATPECDSHYVYMQTNILFICPHSKKGSHNHLIGPFPWLWLCAYSDDCNIKRFVRTNSPSFLRLLCRTAVTAIVCLCCDSNFCKIVCFRPFFLQLCTRQRWTT